MKERIELTRIAAGWVGIVAEGTKLDIGVEAKACRFISPLVQAEAVLTLLANESAYGADWEVDIGAGRAQRFALALADALAVLGEVK